MTRRRVFRSGVALSAVIALTGCGTTGASGPAVAPRCAPVTARGGVTPAMVFMTNFGSRDPRTSDSQQVDPPSTSSRLQLVGLDGCVLASTSVDNALDGVAEPTHPPDRAVLDWGYTVSTTRDRVYFMRRGRLSWMDTSGRQGDAGPLPAPAHVDGRTIPQALSIAVSADDRRVAVLRSQDLGDRVHEELWISDLPLTATSARDIVTADDLMTVVHPGSIDNPDEAVLLADGSIVHFPLGWLGGRVVDEAVPVWDANASASFEVRDPVSHTVVTSCPIILTVVRDPVTAGVLCAQQAGTQINSVTRWDGSVSVPSYTTTFDYSMALAPDGARVAVQRNLVGQPDASLSIVEPGGRSTPAGRGVEPHWVDSTHLLVTTGTVAVGGSCVIADAGGWCDPDTMPVYSVRDLRPHGRPAVALPALGTYQGVIPALLG